MQLRQYIVFLVLYEAINKCLFTGARRPKWRFKWCVVQGPEWGEQIEKGAAVLLTLNFRKYLHFLASCKLSDHFGFGAVGSRWGSFRKVFIKNVKLFIYSASSNRLCFKSVLVCFFFSFKNQKHLKSWSFRISHSFRSFSCPNDCTFSKHGRVQLVFDEVNCCFSLADPKIMLSQLLGN